MKLQKELFDSLKNRYQNNLESMKGSEFVFDYVYLLHYKCHKINPNCGIHDLTVVLNHEEIKKDLQRVTKIKPFPDKYN